LALVSNKDTKKAKTIDNLDDKWRETGGVNCHNWGVWNLIKIEKTRASTSIYM